MDRESHIERTRRYLAASDLAEARAFLASDAVLEFPMGRYASLEDLAAASAGRYRWIAKTHLTWDVAEHEGAVTVVSSGTLAGENVHGVVFEGIRYIDRIVYRDGRIVGQQVYNDLASSGVLERRPG